MKTIKLLSLFVAGLFAFSACNLDDFESDDYTYDFAGNENIGVVASEYFGDLSGEAVVFPNECYKTETSVDEDGNILLKSGIIADVKKFETQTQYDGRSFMIEPTESFGKINGDDIIFTNGAISANVYFVTYHGGIPECCEVDPFVKKSAKVRLYGSMTRDFGSNTYVGELKVAVKLEDGNILALVFDKLTPADSFLSSLFSSISNK